MLRMLRELGPGKRGIRAGKKKKKKSSQVLFVFSKHRNSGLDQYCSVVSGMEIDAWREDIVPKQSALCGKTCS